jgi:uncharacterized protein
VVLDVHAHLFHPRWYPRRFCKSLVDAYWERSGSAGREAGVASSEELLFRMLSDDTGSVTVRLMDKACIDRKVVLIVDWGLELGEAPCSIEKVHEEVLGICRKFSDRLVGFAGVDPRRRQATTLVRHAFDDLGARGLKLHPTGGWRLSDERACEVVALADERQLPVLVHIGKTIDALDERNAQPAALIELARRFPTTRFVAGHSGFELFEIFINEEDLPENLRFDISGWQPLVRDDRSRWSANLLKLVLAFPKRVCYGSDSPFFTYNLAGSERGWLNLVKGFLSESSTSCGVLASGLLSGQDLFPGAVATDQ